MSTTIVLLLGPAWLKQFAPADLGAASAPEAEPENTALLAVRLTATENCAEIGVIAAAHEFSEFALGAGAVLFGSDTEAARLLARAEYGSITVLADAGSPETLWQVAEELGFARWPLDPCSNADRARAAGDLARAAGLVWDEPLFAERRAALAFLLARAVLRRGTPPAAAADGSGAGGGALPVPARSLLNAVDLALLPRSSLSETNETSARRAARKAPLFARRISGDAGGRAPEVDFAAARLARPVLLAEPPPTADTAEEAAITSLLALRRPVPAVPAPDPAVLEPLRIAFPWCDAAITAVARELSLARLAGGPARLPPLLLLGAPGSGKSRLARALAGACGLPLRRIAGPDSTVVTTLAGNGRGWRSPAPCAPVQAIAAAGVRNPLLVIDDADRMPTGAHHGDPRAVLLAMLEPETAAAYPDPLLAAPCDVAAVAWVLTANSRPPLGDALLDRLHLVQIPPPPASALGVILDGMTADLAAELGVPTERLPVLPDTVHAALVDAFDADGTALRRISRALRAGLGAAASGGDPLRAVTDTLAAAETRRPIGFLPTP